MKDQDKTKAQLIEELDEFRRRVAAMESVEAELRRSEAKWRSVAENAPIFVSIVDQSGKMQFLNRYRPGFEPATVLGRPIYDFIQPEYHAVARGCIEHVFQTGERASYECVGAGPEGRVCDYLTDIGPVTVAGEIVAATLISRDITERKQAEAKIEVEHALLEGIIESTNYPVFSLDRNYCYTSFNKSHAATMKAIYGADIELGKSLLEYPTTQEDRSMAKANLDRSLRGERLVLEEYVGEEARSRPCFEISHNPIKGSDGEVVGVAVFAKDITERKRAEEALRRSEQRLSLHFQQTPLAAMEWDTEARVTKWNPGAVRVFGYTEEEALGRDASFIVPPHVREHVEHLRDALLARTGGGRSTNENVTKDGRTILCEWYNTPLIDADGKVIGAASLAEDITEQKRAETQLKQAHDELEQKVQERTAELAIFQRFAEAASQGFGMADLDGRTTYLNQTMCRLLGEEKPEDVIGQLSSDYYPEEFSERREKEIVPAILDRGYWRGELTLRSRQGKLTPTIQHVFLVRDEMGQPCQFAVTILDITELKQAEAALQTSEQKYRTLVETSPDGVIMADLKGHVTYASERVLHDYGATVAEEIVGRNSLDFIAKEDHHRFLNNLRRTVEEGITRDIEYSLLKKDGTHFPGEISAAVIRDASGKPNATVAILRDVTERHRAQEALAESEMKYRLLVETTATGYVILDGEGRIIDANAEYIRISGHHTLKDILGRTVVEWTAPYDLDRNAKEVEKCYRKGFTRQLEIDYVHSDGKIIPIDINATCLDTENGRQIVCLCRDITERRQAQEALQKSEERYELAVRGAGVGIWDYDIRAGRLYFTPRWKALFGYTDSEIGESLEDWIRLLHPDERDWMVKFLEDFLAGTSPTVTVEYRLRYKDGSYRWIVAHAVVVRDDQGKAIRLVGSHGDITDRKLAEEALERERQSLWRMLQASDHERQIISYDIHDGLAQYLAAAGMQFQAHDSLKANSPDAAARAYETAVELVRQAHFESRRLISGVRPPVLDEAGLETAISHLVHEQRRHGGPKIHFDSNVQFDRLPSILENSLYRIVQEALTNACKHSQTKEVKVTFGQQGQEVRLEVQDWGIGFDPESVEKGHFGLEGIRQRVRLLGGQLKIESKPGAGTLVQVVVPIVERQTEV